MDSSERLLLATEFSTGTGNVCRFSYRKMKDCGISLLCGEAAVLPEDGAEQAELLTLKEAMEGVFLEHLLLIEIEKLNCHTHMLQSSDYIRRHQSLPP